MKIPATPELDRRAHQIKILKTQHIGVFLEWAQDHGYHLAKWMKFDELRDPILTNLGVPSINELLAEYAGIDLKVIEQEQRALLAYQRWLNEQKEK